MKPNKNLAVVNPVIDGRERLYRERMQEHARAVRNGVLPAIVDAIMFCHEFEMPPPDWPVDVVEQLVNQKMSAPTGRRGRYSSRLAGWREDQKHPKRHSMVQEVRERFAVTLEKAFDLVAEKKRRHSARWRR